jgi:hypothetical protein
MWSWEIERLNLGLSSLTIRGRFASDNNQIGTHDSAPGAPFQSFDPLFSASSASCILASSGGV